MRHQKLLVLLLLAPLLLIGCGAPATQMTSKLERQIYALDEGPAGRHISVTSIEDDSSLCRVKLELLFKPEAYFEVAAWTNTICHDVHDILEAAGLERDVSVWAMRAIGSGRVILHGRTDYTWGTKTYVFRSGEGFDL